MNCPICRDLIRAFVVRFEEYCAARSSACYRVTTEFAAQKNVDMERARCEVEEHHRVCVEFVRSAAPLPEQDVIPRLRQMAA
jgi:cytidylate kinase